MLKRCNAMNVGFTVFARGGEAEFAVRDPGLADRPPLVTQGASPGLHAVLMGRLYYREELRARLQSAALEPGHASGDSDAALALAVYRERGIDGLECLEGDFALVVWDSGAQRLIAMRDPMGAYPVFHTVHRGTVAASVHMEPLLDRLASRRLNEEYLADYLVPPAFGIEEAADGRTAWLGVQRVPPGSILILHAASGRIERRRYWNWLERRVDPGTDNVAQLGALCLERLRAAVRTRLRGRTASHVSGGMDSTAVALIARDCLEGREPVHALSLVYERFPYLARERPYVESALAEPGLVAHRFNGDKILDFGDLDSVPAHDEPSPGLVRVWPTDRAVAAVTVREGVATVMTGVGSDDIFDMHPLHLADLLRSGRLWAAWREATHWARVRDGNVWRYLGDFGIDNVLPARVLMAAARTTDWSIAPWIRPGFARRMDLRGRGLANLRSAHHACRPAALSAALWGLRGYHNTFSRLHIAAPQGMMLTHPFLDPRLFSLGLGIISRVRPRPDGQKPILKAALRDILPERILNRPSKGHFNESVFTGLSRNLRSLEALVEQAPAEAVEFLDKTVLLDALQRAALGNVPDGRALTPLMTALELLVWLTRQQQQQRVLAAA